MIKFFLWEVPWGLLRIAWYVAWFAIRIAFWFCIGFWLFFLFGAFVPTKK